VILQHITLWEGARMQVGVWSDLIWSDIRRAHGFASGALAIVLMLAACNADDKADQAANTASRAEAEAKGALPPIPVMGPQRRIVAFGDSLFAGYGLNEGESYPDRLEAALRVRGINAGGLPLRSMPSRKNPICSFWSWAAMICCAGFRRKKPAPIWPRCWRS
jgi:hypothetical protein